MNFKGKNLLAFPWRPHVSRRCWLFHSFRRGDHYDGYSYNSTFLGLSLLAFIYTDY